MKARRWLFAIFLSWAAASASAHEFWMLPETFVHPKPDAINLGMFVGVDFQGGRVAFSRTVVARLIDVSAAGQVDLIAGVGDVPVAEFTFAAPKPGTHLIVMDSHPSQIDLPPETFNAYLEDQGLDNARAAREKAGIQSEPGRERFRRNVKTLVQVGSPADDSFSVRIGQVLEIVPLRNPALAHAGEEIAFQVFFEGQPIEGVLVKSWYRQGEQAFLSRARTDAAGTVKFALDHPGTWMVSAVRMVPVTDGTPALDWDSYWANLTFRMPR